jgi:hypothetical protein
MQRLLYFISVQSITPDRGLYESFYIVPPLEVIVELAAPSMLVTGTPPLLAAPGSPLHPE